MLEDMVHSYFKHQKPPGAAFVERGDYRLVHGGIGNLVEPARWTYDLKPGHTVETSMILRERNGRSVKCPRCGTPFNGPTENGWADWKVSQSSMLESLLMFFAARLVLDGFKLKPDVWTAWYHQRGEPGFPALFVLRMLNLTIIWWHSTDGTVPTERRGSEDENEEDGREQFRLISVVDMIDVRFFSSHYDWTLTAEWISLNR
jgi:hypothetical protein